VGHYQRFDITEVLDFLRRGGDAADRSERRPLDRMAIRKQTYQGRTTSWYAIVRDSRGNRSGYTAAPERRTPKRSSGISSRKLLRGIWTQPASRRFDEFVREDFLEYKRPRVRREDLCRLRAGLQKPPDPFLRQEQAGKNNSLRRRAILSCLQGKGLSPRSINKQLVLSRMIFNRAIVLGYLQMNPAQYVDRVREPHKEMPFSLPREIRAFLAVLPEEHRTLFIMAILTGLRQAEIFGLRWSDYDHVRSLLFVRPHLQSGIRFHGNQTAGSRRSVVVSPVLQNHLMNTEETTGRSASLIFTNKAGNPVNGQNLVTRVFHPALKNAGVKRIRFHDLRHTYATLMISAGCNIKVLQRQMGHSSIQTTLDTYAHLLPEAAEGVASRLDEVVFEEGIRPALQLISGGKHGRSSLSNS